VDDVVPLSVKTVKVNPGDDGADSQVNLLGRKAPCSSISHEQDTTVHDFDQDETIPYQEDFSKASNWAPSYSQLEIRSLQLEDHDLQPMIDWLESKQTPTDSILRLHRPATRALWLCRDCLVFREGVLYYQWIERPDKDLCLVVPRGLQPEVLQLSHDSQSTGHLGQRKTLERVKQSFIWYNMSKDCIQYVKTCNQNKKVHIKPRAGLQSFHAGFPMERVHLDILGPFNTSEDGNRYVLMMIDQFTKWMEMAAIPEQPALTIAEKFVVHFVVTFGCPRNFDGNLFKSLCTILEVAKTRTTQYHSSSNGQIERFNTVLLQMIRCYIEKKNRRWDKDIPLFSMALHSVVNRQTGYTPNKLMLGRETIQPVQLLLGIPQQCQEQLDPDS
jgi:hypothetical protein